MWKSVSYLSGCYACISVLNVCIRAERLSMTQTQYDIIVFSNKCQMLSPPSPYFFLNKQDTKCFNSS